MGRTLGEERFAAHEYGHCVVVRWSFGCMAVPEKGREAEAEFDTCDGDSYHRVGDERASTEFKAEHACAFGLWVHTDGSRSGKNCGDCFHIER